MIFSTKESLEDRVIRLLLNNAHAVKDLQKLLHDESMHVTIQGLYKSLGILLSQEIIIKRATIYSLNEEWRNRVVERLSKTAFGLSLSDGEKISFELSSLVHLDQYWKNIVFPLHQAHPEEPIFLYEPHEIWIHLNETRKVSEYAYFSSFAEKKVYAFCQLGGDTIHDRAMKKELQNEYMQVATSVEYFSKTDYPAIFNDYIVTTRLSKLLVKKIEDCYQKSTTMAILEERLHEIGIEKKKVRLIVERNRVKARRLRKKMSKNFFVPQEVVQKFKLF